MFRFLLLAFAIVCTFQTTTQAQLSAYSNNLGYFFIYDKGVNTQVEHLQIQNFKIGGTYVAYNDNTNNFKVWDGKKAVRLQHGGVDTYNPSRYLLCYKMGEQLKVYDNYGARTLGNGVNQFAMGDSIVVYYDRFTRRFSGYYDGEIVDLEDGLINAPITKVKASDNLAAWINPRNYFKVWYQGEVFELQYGDPNVSFDVGRDVVAHYNAAYQSFTVFYQGIDYELGAQRPQSFKAGDGLVAYVSNAGDFRLFYDGEDEQISAFAPTWYRAKDNLVLYAEQDMLKVVYKGEKYTLATFIPEVLQFKQNQVVWMDLNGRLQTFVDGEMLTLSKEQVNSFELGFETVQYHLGVNENKVWWLHQE